MIRELEHMVRLLCDQLKFMNMNPPSSVPVLHHQLQGPNSPQPSAQHAQGALNSLHLRQQNLPPVNPVPPAYQQSFQKQQQQQPPVMHGAWFGSSGRLRTPLRRRRHHSLPSTNARPPRRRQRTGTRHICARHTGCEAAARPACSVEPRSCHASERCFGIVFVYRSPLVDAFKTSIWWLQRTATTLKTNVRSFTLVCGTADFYDPSVRRNVLITKRTTGERQCSHCLHDC
jgi:hypothetical protein